MKHLVTITHSTSEQLLELFESQVFDVLVDSAAHLKGLGVELSGKLDLEEYVKEGQEALTFIAGKVEEWKEPLAALRALLTLVELGVDTSLLAGEAISGVANFMAQPAGETTTWDNSSLQTPRKQLARLKAALPDPEVLDQFQTTLLRLSDQLEKIKQL